MQHMEDREWAEWKSVHNFGAHIFNTCPCDFSFFTGLYGQSLQKNLLLIEPVNCMITGLFH
jgi:hypothetical protein